MDTDLPLYKVSLEPAAAHISFWQVLLITVKKIAMGLYRRCCNVLPQLIQIYHCIN